MKKRYFVKCVTVAVFFLLTGCSSGRIDTERVDNVIRVFWHENSRYSVLVEKSDGVYGTISFPTYGCGSGNEVIIMADIASGEKMWVSAKIRRNSSIHANPCIEQLEIHVHSPKDIEGGAWNHGKFGSGQTHVIN